MEFFHFGIVSILFRDIAPFVLVSFILIGKLSNSFGSHLAKLSILAITTWVLFLFVFLTGPVSAFIVFRSYSWIFLVVTALICLNFLGVLGTIKSVKWRGFIETTVNWLAPFIVGFWLFAQSWSSFGPLMGSSSMVPGIHVQFVGTGLFILMFFGTGVVFVVFGVFTFSWFVHDKIKDTQIWKILQIITALLVLIYSLRTLVEMTFV